MSVTGKRFTPRSSKWGTRTIILAFEQLEAARYLPYLKKGGTMVVNTQQIDPMPVVTGNAVYPEGLIEKPSRKRERKLLALDALSLAEQAGSSKAVNVVLIGVMAKAHGAEQGGMAENHRGNSSSEVY